MKKYLDLKITGDVTRKHISKERRKFNHLVSVRSQLASSLVIIYEKLQSIAFIEAALIGHRIKQNESIGPPDVGLERNTITFLYQKIKNGKLQRNSR
jgi:hypothetical protein